MPSWGLHGYLLSLSSECSQLSLRSNCGEDELCDFLLVVTCTLNGLPGSSRVEMTETLDSPQGVQSQPPRFLWSPRGLLFPGCTVVLCCSVQHSEDLIVSSPTQVRPLAPCISGQWRPREILWGDVGALSTGCPTTAVCHCSFNESPCVLIFFCSLSLGPLSLPWESWCRTRSGWGLLAEGIRAPCHAHHPGFLPNANGTLPNWTSYQRLSPPVFTPCVVAGSEGVKERSHRCLPVELALGGPSSTRRRLRTKYRAAIPLPVLACRFLSNETLTGTPTLDKVLNPAYRASQTML